MCETENLYQNAIKHLTMFMLMKGFTVKVQYDEGFDTEIEAEVSPEGDQSIEEKVEAIYQACGEVEDCYIKVFSAEGESLGAAMPLVCLDDEECIADYVCTPTFNEWNDEYSDLVESL